MTSLLVRALRGESVERVPVWLMRQAGRHLPGYRRLRSERSILDLARDPARAAEITLEPVERYPLDAGVVFADITLPFFGLGVPFSLEPSIGPVVERPYRDVRAVEELHPFEAERDTGYVGRAIELFHERRPDLPLVGFSGTPFLLASYLIEGRPSRELHQTKRLLRSDPHAFALLQRRLGEAIVGYLRMQVRHGADALQLFDSWAGALSRRDYERAVLPSLQELFQGISELKVPKIYFSTGSSHLLELLPKTGADAFGLDWRLPLGAAREALGPSWPLQGNLDPAILLTGGREIEQGAREVLEEIPDGRGHVFNLGHGVPPDATPANVETLVRYVRRYSEERNSHAR